MSEPTTVANKKAHPDNEDLDSLSKNELIARLKEQEQYIKQLEGKKPKLDKDDDAEAGERLKLQQKEAARKENTLVHRLTLKEGELQDYVNQITEIKQAQAQGTAQLRTMLLDPAVNIVFQRMSKEMDEAQEKLKQTQNELSAWKFTPDSQTGKRLMARCQMLLQENEELGKTISSGRTAKLEGEIALQKTLVTEMKNNQSELDEFLGDLEEDVEGMQTMIYVLQQQLRESKEQITALEEENAVLRGGGTADHYKKFTVKERDKFDKEVKSETTPNTAYETFTDKQQSDYAPMETGYYQNDKTDSDIEAEYNYEGLYENEDRYQEELEAQQKGAEAAGKQFDYEENGYRNSGDDNESQTQPESMDTSELEESSLSTVNPNKKLTSPPEVKVKEEPSDSTQTTTNNESNRQQTSISSMETDTQETTEQLTEAMAKVKTDVRETVNDPIGNGQHLDNSKENVNTSPDTNKDKAPESQRTTQGNHKERTPERDNRTSQEESVERTTETNDVVTSEVAKERTPERQPIPSPKPSKNSPGKTNCTKTLNSDQKEDKSNKDHTNSIRDRSPGNGSPKLTNPTDIKDNGSPLTETNSSNGKEKAKLRDREPVLQQFLNGITSTVDDIEDL